MQIYCNKKFAYESNCESNAESNSVEVVATTAVETTIRMHVKYAKSMPFDQLGLEGKQKEKSIKATLVALSDLSKMQVEPLGHALNASLATFYVALSGNMLPQF